MSEYLVDLLLGRMSLHQLRDLYNELYPNGPWWTMGPGEFIVAIKGAVPPGLDRCPVHGVGYNNCRCRNIGPEIGICPIHRVSYIHCNCQDGPATIVIPPVNPRGAAHSAGYAMGDFEEEPDNDDGGWGWNHYD